MPFSERRRYSLVTGAQSAFRPRAAPAAANALLMPRCQSRIVPPVSKVSALIAMAGADITASDKIDPEENPHVPHFHSYSSVVICCCAACPGPGLAGETGLVHRAVPAAWFACPAGAPGERQPRRFAHA